MKFNSFLILFLFPTIVFCQGYTLISGKVVDKNSRKGIAHAYLNIPSKGFSSETNTHGEFKFFFPKINLNSTVIVSVIGYKSFSKKASDFDSTSVIELEAADQFASVQGGDPKTIIKEAFANVKKSFPTYANYQLGYYLETVEIDKLGFVKVKEGIIRIERTHTQKNIDIEPEKIKLLKSRKYEWTEQTAKLNRWSFGNGAAIVTRSLETSIPDYLDKGNINDYDFKIDSLMTYFGDSLVYSISFKPVSKRVKAGRNGKIYLIQNSQSIVRIEYEMTPKGVKHVFKGNIIENTKIEVRGVRAYNQYLPMGGLWRLQDTKLVFEAKFDDKLEKKVSIEAKMTIQFMANESLKMGNWSAIQLGEELLTTESFVRGGKFEESFWKTFNYLIPTSAMLKIADKR
jgi:hypothetical protein